MCRRHEALEAAIDECKKLGRSYRIEMKKRHYQMFIDGCKKVLTISDTRALCNVRTDVRRAIKGV